MTLGPGCITDPFPLLRRRFPHGSQLLNFSLLSLVSILTLRFLSSFCSHIKISRWCKYCSRSGRGDGELRRHFSSSHFTSDTVPVSKDLRPLSAGYLVIWCWGVSGASTRPVGVRPPTLEQECSGGWCGPCSEVLLPRQASVYTDHLLHSNISDFYLPPFHKVTITFTTCV